MTIDARCLVCKNPDLRRMVELAWNGGMGFEPIARTLDRKGFGVSVITRHIKDHADGSANSRAIEVQPELPVRERVLALQRMQLDEVERRIELAKQRAADINAAHVLDADWSPVDWSDIYDILSPKAQAAIGSILKTQGLNDRREKDQGELKLGLFDSMAKAGLAPKSLVGGADPLQLESGEDEDDD